VADEVLKEVRLDPRTLPGLIESINEAAGRQRVVLNTAGAAPELSLPPPPLQDDEGTVLWDVRLGTALAIGARGAFVSWRETHQQLVVDDPVTAEAPPPLLARVYDVRDLLADAEAWAAPLRGTRPRNAGGLFGGGGGATAGAMSGRVPPMTLGAGCVFVFLGAPTPPVSDETATAAGVAGLIKDVVNSEPWDETPAAPRAEGWGGWLYVRASEVGHRRVERLLALLRRGDSGSVRSKGAVGR
jgi:hypothetical protein